ncbi:M48 family metallopeptidase [Pusillimonas minor]|uniref:M48 family metalloprotease n=1 Tax=Pusillimonas minor TaxID=2697024 RepID=A0A842HSH1_9BURK|nr:M48 family metallopeptidase [Pusillimonas minor]MBC2770181.1 M48 family metalloprotease [Pusillimonas minor]
MPAALNSESPYLQQLSPEKINVASDAEDVQEDVRKMQSMGLGLVYYPELEQLLNDELQRIKSASDFTDVPGRVYILASPTMNALTTDQGNIYIPIGMLMDIQSVDEIDALLAHEFAHTVLSHTDIDILKEIQKKGTAAYALVNRLGVDAGNAESVARRIRNSFALYMATEKVLSPTWSRTQETDADKLAVDFLIRAGRNVNGMTALLGRLDQWDKINASLREDDKPKQSMLVAVASSQFAQNEWQALFIQALEPLGQKIEDGIAQASHTHLSPEERLSDVNDYIRAHYRKAARPAMDSKTWRRVAHNQKGKRLAKSVVQSHVAFRSVSQGKTNVARAVLAKSRHRDVNGQTFYQLALASVAEDRGRSQEVLAMAEASATNVYDSYRLHVMAQQAKARQAGGKADSDELAALYKQFDAYGRPAEFYYDLIQLADTTDNLGIQVELGLRCQAAYFGDANACSSGKKQAEVKQEAGLVGGLLGIFGN